MAVLLKNRDLERIGAVVDQVEGTPINRKTSNRAQNPIHQSGDQTTVRVTSATTTAGRYPGKLLQLDPTTGSYSDLTDIWITEMNGGTLAVKKYPARRNGTADGTDATLPVFEVMLGGGATLLVETDDETTLVVTDVFKIRIASPLKLIENAAGDVTIGLKTPTLNLSCSAGTWTGTITWS